MGFKVSARGTVALPTGEHHASCLGGKFLDAMFANVLGHPVICDQTGIIAAAETVIDHLRGHIWHQVMMHKQCLMRRQSLKCNWPGVLRVFGAANFACRRPCKWEQMAQTHGAWVLHIICTARKAVCIVTCISAIHLDGLSMIFLCQGIHSTYLSAFPLSFSTAFYGSQEWPFMSPSARCMQPFIGLYLLPHQGSQILILHSR